MAIQSMGSKFGTNNGTIDDIEKSREFLSQQGHSLIFALEKPRTRNLYKLVAPFLESIMPRTTRATSISPADATAAIASAPGRRLPGVPRLK